MFSTCLCFNRFFHTNCEIFFKSNYFFGGIYILFFWVCEHSCHQTTVYVVLVHVFTLISSTVNYNNYSKPVVSKRLSFEL